ncbi:DNA replication licensing factor MCM2, putative, partial [Ixodes scapularis]
DLNQSDRTARVVASTMEVLPQVSLVKYTCGKCNYDQGPFVHSENQAFKPESCPECRSLGPFKIKIKQ